MDLKPKIIGGSFAAIAALELLSLASHFWPGLNLLGFGLVLLTTLIVSLISLEWGILIVLAELFIGSQGYLFSLNLGGVSLSLRIGLFLVVLAVWLTKKIKNRDGRLFRAPISYYYLVLFGFIALGLAQGIARNDFGNVFFDFNAWLFFGLIFVFLDQNFGQNQRPNLISVLIAATGFLALKTLALLILFSHGWSAIGDPLYTWVRDSRLAEITYVDGTIFRIFFQSQIYLLIGFLIILALTVSQWLKLSRGQKTFLISYLYLNSLAVLISQSRSFWLGLIAGLIILTVLFWRRANWRLKKSLAALTLLVVLVVSQLFLIQLVTDNFSGNLIGQRFRGLEKEAAGLSRLNQLEPLTFNIFQQFLFGYGFGKTLTYISNDPRILQSHPSGVYTTYAFEWGYLDIMLKLGTLGLLSYLILIFGLIKTGIKKISADNGLTIGLLAGLAALLVTNVFSPYLNHPLGIGYIMLVSGLLNKTD